MISKYIISKKNTLFKWLIAKNAKNEIVIKSNIHSEAIHGLCPQNQGLVFHCTAFVLGTKAMNKLLRDLESVFQYSRIKLSDNRVPTRKQLDQRNLELYAQLTPSENHTYKEIFKFISTRISE